MYAVEFETVTDGKTIQIPDEYCIFDPQNIRVILLMDQKKTNREDRIPGTAKGRLIVSEDFDEPLDEETLGLFYK